ncbi:hypothetical protein AKJ51_02145 [candidate division MSBL1 archaeon SCGC-AAA382A20]|uniref:Uncharacterized protein n=1 Tax=candidate division MSBL1 archaeon SCGC-AAA382A20 TaxID=1698280 RepID=A0A133VKU3_9EURY|nr:hypothetical protein AKJ51_02145 [candidate division MSBL1 archaeon SCGC-AAA382A20]
MIFQCHIPFCLNSKCEWRFIKGFVDLYNREYGTEYSRKVCPDVQIRDNKQPEVILEDGTTGKEIVIERKTVVWPVNYIENHVHWHQKAEEKARRGDYYEESFQEEFTLEARHKALKGFSEQLKSALESVPDKFASYKHAIRILMLQFIGNDSLVSDADIVEMIEEAEVPKEIHEIWVAYPEWINEWESEVSWRQLYKAR